eukprot:CAMPEP_0168327782 /NCGR_PEP_ID=MMETSP0213-20121227/6088_1 /TAXON_ID=151035 /ORGANISM="Euplotes harpa, Strain FSP1.4" /LENGTH=251 /DNA_ID=CAMNT_0008330723 /DNA_START=444 /DNA_END=1199 /DNA_ORIENTATION=-
MHNDDFQNINSPQLLPVKTVKCVSQPQPVYCSPNGAAVPIRLHSAFTKKTVGQDDRNEVLADACGIKFTVTKSDPMGLSRTLNSTSCGDRTSSNSQSRLKSSKEIVACSRNLFAVTSKVTKTQEMKRQKSLRKRNLPKSSFALSYLSLCAGTSEVPRTQADRSEPESLRRDANTESSKDFLSRKFESTTELSSFSKTIPAMGIAMFQNRQMSTFSQKANNSKFKKTSAVKDKLMKESDCTKYSTAKNLALF